VSEECRKYGEVASVNIPRPEGGKLPPGCGYIFVEFADKQSASKAKKALHGRRFAAKIVHADFFPLDDYRAGVSANPHQLHTSDNLPDLMSW